MLRPVGKQRVAEEIVEQLRGLILRVSFAPGDQLPPERKLAAELGAYRASLPHATQPPPQTGLAQTRPRHAPTAPDFTRPPRPHHTSHPPPSH
ncbi:GntR family transcriptional regulator, partial [Escherichia coli]|uniref:GntR family transcriptional regulator n=1 Tax=Escherichia coli TaxID=562 RepID=UPI000DEE4631